MTGCRCGWRPCTADPDLAIEATWRHIEQAHTRGVIYEPGCLQEGPDEASTCYLPLGHDQPHEWTPNDRPTVPRVMTPETERALKRAGRLAKKAVEDRDALIRQAVAEGGSLREVGEAVGLSHQAVKFIAHGRSRQGEQP